MPRGARLDAPGTLHHVGEFVSGIIKDADKKVKYQNASDDVMDIIEHDKHMSERKCQTNRSKSREPKAAVTENKEATDREVCW